MITKIILKYENLEEEQEHKLLDWLANCEEKKEIPFKLFLHKGGVNNKMVEILNECASRDSEPSGKQGSKRQDKNKTRSPGINDLERTIKTRKTR